MENKNVFTQKENDLLTQCSDERDEYCIKLDVANQMVMFDKTSNTPVHIFGELGVDLFMKLMDMIQVDASTIDGRVMIKK